MSGFEWKLLWRQRLFRFKLLTIVMLTCGLFFVMIEDLSERELAIIESNQLSQDYYLASANQMMQTYGENNKDVQMMIQLASLAEDQSQALQRKDYRAFVQKRYKFLQAHQQAIEELNWAQSNVLDNFAFEAATTDKVEALGLELYQATAHSLEQLLAQDTISQPEALGKHTTMMVRSLFLGESPQFINFWLAVFLVTLFLVSQTCLERRKNHQSFTEIIPQSKAVHTIATTVSNAVVVTIFQILLLILVLISYTFVYSFGHLSVTIRRFGSSGFMSLIVVIALCLAMLWGLNMLITALTALFNQLFNNQVLTLFVVVLFICFIPMVNTLEVDASWFQYNPFSYVEIGHVVWGVQHYFFTEGSFSLKEFWWSIVFTVTAIYGMLYGVAYFKQRN